MTARLRQVVGCMTGTSLDGLDVVLTRIEGEALNMRAKFERMASRSFPDDLRQKLRSLASAEPHPAQDFVRAARALGQFHADLLADFLQDTPVDFIVTHGQTIFHDGDAHLSWQLFDPWPIVQQLHVPVCYDLRQANLIAGGPGAPITPLADWVIFRARAECVLNLGGIANVSVLAADPADVRGRDVGPCNLLIDGLCQRLFGKPFDRNGQCAAQGGVRTEAVNMVLARIEKVAAGQSLGREQFNDAWLDELVTALRNRFSPADALRSAIEAVATVIAGSLVGRSIVAGGGLHNPTLLAALHGQYAGQLVEIDELAIAPEGREAMGFAVLGALSQDSVPITSPQSARAGVWAYP
ncbi:MAG: anhydro-N-acetylmuramic acid kinase [Phycisphaeraceae bacterium]|nr:anhydro-N-acetylmuramic acid kinase [Phycisphaeraceae bacterium]